MEDIDVSLRSYHEMSAGILSETSSWTIDLSSMPRIIQELISRYFMEEMVCRSVNGRIKHKSQCYQLFKEQYVKKVVTKNNISKRQKMFFGYVYVAASSKKICMMCTSIFARIKERFAIGNIYARFGLWSLQTLCYTFLSAA